MKLIKTNSKNRETVTFMIGNGFDINLGLKTAYSSFYKYYLSSQQCLNDDPLIIKMKSELRADIANWSDLEIALGKYTGNLDNFFESKTCYEDITSSLEKYLKNECKKNLIIDENILNNFSRNLARNISANIYHIQTRKYMCNYDNSNKEYKNIYMINFNYTNTVEKLLGEFYKQFYPLDFETPMLRGEPDPFTKKDYWEHYKKCKNEPEKLSFDTPRCGIESYLTPIHGEIERDAIIGVNDVSQLELYQQGGMSKIEAMYLTKQEMNTTFGRRTNLSHCFEMLEKSSIIYIYGMSLGDSDRLWWDKLCELLKENKNLHIIYDYFYEDTIFKSSISDSSEEVEQFNERCSVNRQKILAQLKGSKYFCNSMDEQFHIIPNTGMFKVLNNIAENPKEDASLKKAIITHV